MWELLEGLSEHQVPLAIDTFAKRLKKNIHLGMWIALVYKRFKKRVCTFGDK